ncbi:hypothetical protein CYMTET_21063 [Cymbomonas tetramitiformis]|uniref:SET domain-containing protein n=1 Tax=Cymbomonas tetramitiformis TaxID=36881 RepID=A0AAE0L3C5_9CHLO|nr:hypothetical protein CYMTET_21063 [Cymbomonas tetramitiformis]
MQESALAALVVSLETCKLQAGVSLSSNLAGETSRGILEGVNSKLSENFVKVITTEAYGRCRLCEQPEERTKVLSSALRGPADYFSSAEPTCSHSILDPDLDSSCVQNLVKQVDNDLVILDRLREEHATKNPSWKIQKIANTSHPAYGESGLFAERDLNPGELIVEYKGVITDKSDGLSGKSDYVIELTPALSIDAEDIGNEGRFVNDYRGTPVCDDLMQQTPSFGVKEKHNRKPKPHKQSRAAPSEYDKNKPGPKSNADFKTFIFTDSPDSLHIGIFVKTLSKKEIKLQQTSGKSRNFHGIRQGQEVLVSYGRRYWHKRGLYLDNDFDAWAERYGWEWE